MGKYKVVIKGHNKELDVDLVLNNLSILFKCTPDQMHPLLASNNFVAKGLLELDEANKYQRALEDVGCIVIIEPELIESELSFDISEMTYTADSVNQLPSADSDLIEETDAEIKTKAAFKLKEFNIGKYKNIVLLLFGVAILIGTVSSGIILYSKAHKNSITSEQLDSKSESTVTHSAPSISVVTNNKPTKASAENPGAANVAQLPIVKPDSLGLIALKELYGVTDPSGKVKSASNKQSSIWFEQSFKDGNDNLHVVFIKTQSLDEQGEIDGCHGCSAEIGAVTYKQANDNWQLISKQQKITEIGSYGDAPAITQAEILQLSSDKIAFLIEDGYSNQGQTDSGKDLLVFSKNNWRDIGVVITDSDDSGNCEEGDVKHCFSYEGKISVISGNKEYPDLLVTKTGTEKNGKGNVIPAKNSVYVFNGNSYEKYEQTAEAISASEHMDSQYVKNMLEGSLKDNEKMIADNKSLLEGLPEPLKGDRKSARRVNNEGLIFIQKKQYENAVPLLEKASNLDLSDIEVMNNYGYALMKSNQLERAESVLSKALEIKPDRVSAWANYADTMALSGKEDFAVAAYLNAFRFSKDREKTVQFFNKQLQVETNSTVRSAIEKALVKYNQLFGVQTPENSSPSQNSSQSNNVFHASLTANNNPQKDANSLNDWTANEMSKIQSDYNRLAPTYGESATTYKSCVIEGLNKIPVCLKELSKPGLMMYDGIVITDQNRGTVPESYCTEQYKHHVYVCSTYLEKNGNTSKTQQNTASTSASYQNQNDTVAAYAESLASQIERSPLPACGSLANNIRMLGNSSAPDYIRARQIDTLFDKAPSICLH